MQNRSWSTEGWSNNIQYVGWRCICDGLQNVCSMHWGDFSDDSSVAFCGICVGRWNWQNFSRLWLRCTVTWRCRSCIVIWRSVWVVTCKLAAARWYLTSLIQFTQSWQVTRLVSGMSWFHALIVLLRSCAFICMVIVLLRFHCSFHIVQMLCSNNVQHSDQQSTWPVELDQFQQDVKHLFASHRDAFWQCELLPIWELTCDIGLFCSTRAISASHF